MAGQDCKGRKGIEMKESRNIYISSCCNVQANKPALLKAAVVPKKKGQRHKPENSRVPEVGLGKWSCSQCGRATKVSVHARPQEVSA
jgi:hypothetical protein